MGTPNSIFCHRTRSGKVAFVLDRTLLGNDDALMRAIKEAERMNAAGLLPRRPAIEVRDPQAPAVDVQTARPVKKKKDATVSAAAGTDAIVRAAVEQLRAASEALASLGVKA